MNRGLGEHNVGGNFQRAAETRASELRGAGHNVTVSQVSSVGDFNSAINSGAKVDGGAEYFGHGWEGSLYPGEGSGADTNINAGNVTELSGANLTSSATVTLNACNSGAGGANSIAQSMANQLGVTVKGADKPMGFTGEKGQYLHGAGAKPPATGPIYMTPPNESNWKTFEPNE